MGGKPGRRWNREDFVKLCGMCSHFSDEFSIASWGNYSPWKYLRGSFLSSYVNSSYSKFFIQKRAGNVAMLQLYVFLQALRTGDAKVSLSSYSLGELAPGCRQHCWPTEAYRIKLTLHFETWLWRFSSFAAIYERETNRDDDSVRATFVSSSNILRAELYSSLDTECISWRCWIINNVLRKAR